MREGSFIGRDLRVENGALRFRLEGQPPEGSDLLPSAEMEARLDNGALTASQIVRQIRLKKD